MNQVISIKEKSVWGNVLMYPNNEVANKFIQLLGKKTFALIDLKIIESLGYKLEYIPL
jgi:hypothetical protein